MAKTNDPEHLFDQPMTVRTEGPAVVILGPDAVAISMTPQAAARSADLLKAAAQDAEAASAETVPALPIDQT